jgi:hypothetical protein
MRMLAKEGSYVGPMEGLQPRLPARGPAGDHRGVCRAIRAGINLDKASGYTGDSHMEIRFVPNDKGNPAGKLADAELHFAEGPLAGLKLIGFAIWERRNASGHNVTFPARSYSVNGSTRSFVLLRPVGEDHAQDQLRDRILRAYAEYAAEVAVAS